MMVDGDDADDLGVALGEGLHLLPPAVVGVAALLAAPLTAWRSSPRLDAASGPAEEAEDDAPFDPAGALGLGSPGVVRFCSGDGSGGLPKGPEPAGGLLGW